MAGLLVCAKRAGPFFPSVDGNGGLQGEANYVGGDRDAGSDDVEGCCQAKIFDR